MEMSDYVAVASDKEAFYGIPAVLIAECRNRIDEGCS